MAQKRRGCLAIFFPRKGVNPETVALSSAAERLPLAFPYRPRKSMLSAAELVFYNVLKTAIGARFVILLKVGVSDLCEITSREVNQAAFNRIAAKRVDFVLCDPITLAPAVAIELDDSTHYRRDRAERDAFVNEVFRVIGVALIRHRVQSSYDPAALARWIDASLPPPSTRRPLRPAS
ncbi:MAG: DUF2726 domain-containing protein [Chloroflexi bacterium]|nr:MAG: DUF2726 domain-containing protein [Chloroflexota bacterium]